MNEPNLENLIENNLIPLNPENEVVICQQKMENVFKKLCEILEEVRVVLAELENGKDQGIKELMEERGWRID